MGRNEKAIARIRSSLRRGLDPREAAGGSAVEMLLDRYASFADRRDRDGFICSSDLEVHDAKTPRPSLHLMASCHSREFGTWGSYWDQFGGGFSCMDSVMAGRMTSHLDTNYVPTAPQPQDSRGFYVHESGDSWPMFMQADHEEGEYGSVLCRHGLDTHHMSAERNGLSCELDVMVHPDRPVEIMTVRIRNKSGRRRRFSWFSRIRVNVDSFPFYYFVPRVVCEGVIEDRAMLFVNHDKSNKHPRQAFFASEPHFDGFDMMGELFDGMGGRSAIPPAVQKGRCTGSLGVQPYAGLVAAAQFNADLKAGEIREWTLGYGACPLDKAERKKFLREFRKDLRNPSAIGGKLSGQWDKWIDSLKIKTPSPDLDRYFNVWSRYQARNQSRFVRALDKVGYRDVLQDLLGICDFNPEYVRTMLLRTLQYQFPDGRAVRQFEKFPNSGCDMRMYMDSPSWIPDTLAEYLKESGDFTFLDVEVPYFDEKGMKPDPSKTGTVYEHALMAVKSLASHTGHHGLCRIGYGDWNDALSGIGGSRGVSVWLSCACVHAARTMASIAEKRGAGRDANDMNSIAERMSDAVNGHGWDGRWYVYAIDDAGRPVGSAKCREGRIHLNVNAWAIFTGIARKAGREEQVWKSLESLDTPLGHLLMAPSYTAASRKDVGRIADILPGMFENGSIYLHGESFFLYALARSGKADECFTKLLRVLPSSMIQDIATGPRHQQSNFTVGPDHPQFGTQLFSNSTGSLSWFRRIITELVGVKPGFDSLQIAFSAPESWNGHEVFKVWRGRRIRIKFSKARAGKPRGIFLDGKRYDAEIPLGDFSKAGTNIVEVEI